MYNCVFKIISIPTTSAADHFKIGWQYNLLITKMLILRQKKACGKDFFCKYDRKKTANKQKSTEVLQFFEKIGMILSDEELKFTFTSRSM